MNTMGGRESHNTAGHLAQYLQPNLASVINLSAKPSAKGRNSMVNCFLWNFLSGKSPAEKRNNFLRVSSGSGKWELPPGTARCCTRSWRGARSVPALLCHGRNGLASSAPGFRAGQWGEKRKKLYCCLLITSCLKWYHHLLPIYTTINPPSFLPPPPLQYLSSSPA